jgi:hypothetical protein
MSESYRRNQTFYQNVSTTYDFAATDGNLTALTGKANTTIFVQRIIVVIKTSAAQTITFQDTAGSPVYVSKIASAPGVDTTWQWDFGPRGKQLTSGKDLQQVMTAGNAGHVEIEAYRKTDHGVVI